MELIISQIYEISFSNPLDGYKYKMMHIEADSQFDTTYLAYTNDFSKS